LNVQSAGEFVDKRELRDVIFHESDHDRQTLALPRITGKPIRKRLPRRKDRARIVFDCRMANDPDMIQQGKHK